MLQPHLARETYSSQPACWKTSGTVLIISEANDGHLPVVKPGPVIELTRSAIPPQNPISGLYILPACSRRGLEALALKRRKIAPFKNEIEFCQGSPREIGQIDWVSKT